MSGLLSVVGLGPGAAHWITPEAEAALIEASDLVGYAAYLARVPKRPGQARHPSDNRVELDRAHLALDLAGQGRRVVVVSGGDPGVFAMAAAVFEALEQRPIADRLLPVTVVPGISAMLAAAARLGAPLGHDFCAISLSDNLKPWPVIEQRLRLAAEADFVMALYNPVSRARPDQLRQAFAALRTVKDAASVVALAHAVGRPDERLVVTTLGEADREPADMATLVIVGSTMTRLVERPGERPWMLTPRSYGEAR